MKIRKNIGSADRWVRLVIAILLMGCAYWKSSWIALVLSLFVFFESFASWCIVYQILGKSSCPIKKR